MVDPGCAAKPASGSAAAVSSTSPELPLTVSTAPVYVPTGTETLARSSAISSSSARLIMGAGVGAVYTVTLPPPPCGTNAIDRTLTPMVAQSSVDASLTNIDTLAVC